MMNNKMIIAGSSIIVGSAIAYYFLREKPPIPPTPNGNGNGNDHGCTGACYYEGYTECDRYNNLCKCVNGEAKLIERNSPICLTGESHLECFPSIPGNIITCVSIPGPGTDKCLNMGYSAGCSCLQGDCDVFHYCEPIENKCVLIAKSIPISAIADQTMSCDAGDPGNHFCTYDIVENHAAPLVARRLEGTLFYKWGPWPFSWGDLQINGYYKGQKYDLGHWGGMLTEPDGQLQNLIFTFPPHPLDKIEFNLGCFGTNIHIESFIGTLLY